MRDSDLTQAALGELASHVHGARSAVFAAAARWDAGDWGAAEAQSLMAVHLAKRAALEATSHARSRSAAREPPSAATRWRRGSATSARSRCTSATTCRCASSAAASWPVAEPSKAALDTSVLPGRNA